MSGTESPRGSRYDLEDKGAGWVFFAASMLGLAGIIGVIHGITVRFPVRSPDVASIPTADDRLSTCVMTR